MTTEVDGFLEHFGVLGMKWGKRKRQDTPVPDHSADPKDEKRDARRQAKSDKILLKADKVQNQIDELKKNGTNSDYMLAKYGTSMGVDSRAADMKVQFLYGYSKQQLLDAELKGLEASKAHFVADADAAAKGKLTSKDKMLIGAGVATVIVAAGITIAVVHDKQQKNQALAEVLAKKARHESRMQDEGYAKSVMAKEAERAAARLKRAEADAAERARFDNIAPGSKISYDDYWKKIEHTEISRISGISKDAFDKMDETPISVPAGHIFKRVSTDKEEVLRERIFAAYKDEDVDRYKAVLPKFWGAWGIGSAQQGGYVVDIKAKEAITSPSQKARVKEFIDLMDQDIKTTSFSGKESIVKGRELLYGGSDKTKTNEEIALASYRQFSLGLVNKTPLGEAYFDKLKAKGFNAIIDDNDSGKLSESPMLIFNTSKSMERLGATPLTAENIGAARAKLIEVASRM